MKLNKKTKIRIGISILILIIVVGSLVIWKYYPTSSNSMPEVSNITPSPIRITTASLTPIQNTPTVVKTIEPLISQIPSPTSLPTESPITDLPEITESIPSLEPIEVQSEITIGDQTKNQIIFTFDGGSGTQSMQGILNTLEKHNVKGTFFVTGNWASANTQYVKEISDKGHEIFNHTYTHPYLTQISDEDIALELKNTEDLIFQLTGNSTKPYFRPPYGDRNENVLEVAGKEGYRSVYWTIDALDWKENEGYTPDQVKQRIYENQRPGAIILMHIGDNITGEILDEVFTKLENDGYQIVALTQGL